MRSLFALAAAGLAPVCLQLRVQAQDAGGQAAPAQPPASSAPAAPSSAPAQDVRIEFKVTQVAASVVYIDAGRDRGLVEGDRVLFTDANGITTEGVVRAVSRQSARVELVPGTPPVERGALGETRIPAARLETKAQGETVKKPENLPAHPGWAAQEQGWSSDKPLLAPVTGLKPEDRPSKWNGLLWSRFDSSTSSMDEGSDTNYMFFSVGGDATLRNPFGRGGSLRIDAEAISKVRDDSIEDESESYLSIDRLYYEVGGTREEPTRWQFGRFYSSVFTQLGLVDGVEYSHRAGSDVYGGSVGWLPERNSERKSFVDLAVNAFWKHEFDEKRRDTLGFAFQNSLHDGEQDRTLFIIDGEKRIQDSITLRGTAWIDLYGSEDVVKGSGAELTEARLQAVWKRTADDGLGASISHIRWPEMLREGWSSMSPTLLADGELNRASAWGWQDWNRTWRTDERIDVWADQDDSGASWELETSARDWAWERGRVAFALTYADGSYSKGPGVRVSADKQFDEIFGTLGWTWYQYEEKDWDSADSSIFAQHMVYGSADWSFADSWNLSMRLDKRFDDTVDVWSVGLMLSTRF